LLLSFSFGALDCDIVLCLIHLHLPTPAIHARPASGRGGKERAARGAGRGVREKGGKGGCKKTGAQDTGENGAGSRARRRRCPSSSCLCISARTSPSRKQSSSSSGPTRVLAQGTRDEKRREGRGEREEEVT
jgi:hypothetical protein